MTKKIDPSYLELSPWAPFKYPIFRLIWTMSIVSNIGTCMHDVGAAWLMTSLTSKPLLVALVQAASSFPIFLLALPAGAFADIIDRRRYLIVLQTIMMIIALTLASVTYFKIMTPNLLLLLTFCLGAAGALSAPTWQASVPELVPANTLAGAINLNSAGVNISRAIGPALAGMIIAAGGTAAVFALNSLSFLGIIIALFYWRRATRESTLPAERFFSAIRTGIRYVYASPALHRAMIRAATFIFFASSIWALLPLVARTELQYGPSGYGILLGLLGTGAVIGAIVLPRMNLRFHSDQIMHMGFLIYAISSLALALLKTFYFASGAMLLCGFAWLIVLSTLMTATQQAVPSWVRGRALSIYFMVVYGGMAIGSTTWGVLTAHYTISIALIVSAMGLIFSTFLTSRFKIRNIRDYDHTPYRDLPALVATEELSNEQGPVMVTMEYSIDKENEAQFTRVMRKLRRIRLREGAFFWKLFKDTENPTRYIECFMSESWVDHLRFHERISVSDRKVQESANAFHNGKKSPRASHFVACDLSKKTPFK